MAVEVIDQGFVNNGWWFYSRMQAPSGHVFGITLDVRSEMVLTNGASDAGCTVNDAIHGLVLARDAMQEAKARADYAAPTVAFYCAHEGYEIRRQCSGCGERLARDWPSAPRLKPDDVDLIIEGLQMLAGYVVADVSSADEMLDQAYEDAARIKGGPNAKGKVEVADDETEDLVAAGNAFADGQEKAEAIEALEARLRPYATPETKEG